MASRKKIIPGTASFERRDNQPVSKKAVGHGRYNEGSYIGGYLTQKKYVNKRTGKAESEDEYKKKRAKGYLVENLSPTRPGSIVKRSKKR